MHENRPTEADIAERIKAAYVKVGIPPVRGRCRPVGDNKKASCCCGLVALLSAEFGFDENDYGADLWDAGGEAFGHNWSSGFTGGFDALHAPSQYEYTTGDLAVGFRVGHLAAVAMGLPCDA